MSYSEYKVAKTNDIQIGGITIKWGGFSWILPGGEKTTDKKTAIEKALILSRKVAQWEEKQVSDQKPSHRRQPTEEYSTPKY